MQKRHFEAMANLVRAILNGEWTHELPIWSGYDTGGDLAPIEVLTDDAGNLDVNKVRAIWTAEAFIILARAHNPRFDERRFLKACGLAS